MMNHTEILAALDFDRRFIGAPGFRLESEPKIARFIAEDAGGPAWVAWSGFDEAEIDAAIEREKAYFAALGRGFEWKVYDHDQPADLRQRLLAHGAQVEEAEAFMVLDTQNMPEVWAKPITKTVRKIENPAELKDFAAVENAVWAGRSHHVDWPEEMRKASDVTSFYVAYDGGKPVSAARASFYPGSLFCGLWGGATLAEYRERGYYTALVAARVQEAIRRGVRFVSIDAAPTSRPILEKRGFEFVTNTYPCVFNAK